MKYNLYSTSDVVRHFNYRSADELEADAGSGGFMPPDFKAGPHDWYWFSDTLNLHMVDLLHDQYDPEIHGF